MRPFNVAADPNQLGNGDLAIRTDKGRLVALVYARSDAEETTIFAKVIENALCAAFAPGHTDLMVSPEELDDWLENNPPYSAQDKRIAELETLCCDLQAECTGYAQDAASAERRVAEARRAEFKACIAIVRERLEAIGNYGWEYAAESIVDEILSRSTLGGDHE